MYIHLPHVRYTSQETTKSDEFCGNSARIPQSFCAANRRIAVLLPRRVSPISAEWYFAVRRLVFTKLMSSIFVERLYCIRIWHTSFALVAMYVHYTLCSLFKPSSAGDSKTTISTYAAVIRYTTVHPSRAAFDNPQLCTAPLRQFHLFDYYKPTTLWLF